MFESLFGNATVQKVLFYLFINGEAYAKRISDDLGIALNGVQQQLQRLQEGEILLTSRKGKTVMYRFNPQFPLLKELRALLAEAIRLLNKEELSNYYREEEESMEYVPSVRAMIVQNGHLLVAAIGGEGAFLPGGAIDATIGATESLKHLLKDQFNGSIEIDGLAGIVESPKGYGENAFFQMDIVYNVRLLNYTHPAYPKGATRVSSFYWHPIKKLRQMSLEPEGMMDFVEARSAEL